MYSDPKPFYVYTRKYLSNGDCIKGRYTYATRAIQQRMITRLENNGHCVTNAN